MNIAIVFSVLFLFGGIYNFYQGVYDEGAAGLLVAAILAGLFLFNKRQEEQIHSFLIWLSENKHELARDKTAARTWNEVPVKYDSYVTQYQFCTSFLIVSFKQPTAFILENSQSKAGVNFICSIVTLIFGWWGIPWGPIYTVQTIFRNLRGGVKTSIEDLIARLENAETGEVERS